MFSKSIIAALIFASAAVALSAKANAGPSDKQTGQTESFYTYRPSQNHDNGGN